MIFRGLDHPGPQQRQFHRIVLDYEKRQRDLGGWPSWTVLGYGRRRRDLGGCSILDPNTDRPIG